MEIRRITPDFAVAPQLEPSDMAEIAAAGFVAVINNRPDAEVQPPQQAQAMRAAAEAAGLAYVENPVINGALTLEMVTRQGAAAETHDGPVLAWCRTGTRSSTVWALAQAGQRPTPEIMGLLKQAGYDLPALAVQIDMLAAQKAQG